MEAGLVEVRVHVELGPELLTRKGKHRIAVVVLDVRVLVGEPLAVGAHDDDMSRDSQIGLQVLDRTAGGGIGEAEGQLAGLADPGSAVKLDADAVDDLTAGGFGELDSPGRRLVADPDAGASLMPSPTIATT